MKDSWINALNHMTSLEAIFGGMVTIFLFFMVLLLLLWVREKYHYPLKPTDKEKW
jgi:hypothetical protein